MLVRMGQKEKRVVVEEGQMVVGFTGHRPDKLFGSYDLENPKVRVLKEKLEKELVELIEKGATVFVSGGALGFDQVAFMTVHGLKEKYPGIKNILAIPFEKQAKAWRSKKDVARYEKMKEKADEVVYVDCVDGYKPKGSVEAGDYSAAKMQLRNQYMVDKSNVIIAAWDGSSGGTKNCVDYAKKEKKDIIRLDPLSNFDKKS